MSESSREIGQEKVGSRIYMTGDTFGIKDRLKAAGFHWDGERRQWWIGSSQAPKVDQILEAQGEAKLDGAPAPKEDLDRARVHAKVEYKGRSYYAIAETRDGLKYRLVTLDGSVDFWGARQECRVLKTYPPREVFRGYGRGGRRTEYTTLGSIRRFVERQKDPATRRGQCTECGGWGPVGETCRECHEGTFA